MESLEERIARAVLKALRKNQSVPLEEVPPLPRDPPLNSPPTPRESPIATPHVSREEEESSSMSSPRRLVHGEVDVLKDLKKYLIKPSFGGKNYKPEEVMSFISMVEDFFPSKYMVLCRK